MFLWELIDHSQADGAARLRARYPEHRHARVRSFGLELGRLGEPSGQWSRLNFPKACNFKVACVHGLLIVRFEYPDDGNIFMAYRLHPITSAGAL